MEKERTGRKLVCKKLHERTMDRVSVEMLARYQTFETWNQDASNRVGESIRTKLRGWSEGTEKDHYKHLEQQMCLIAR